MTQIEVVRIFQHIENNKNNKALDTTINNSELNKKSKTDNICAPSGLMQVKVDEKKRKLGKTANVLPLDWSSDDNFVTYIHEFITNEHNKCLIYT